jgi:hypothetical protein
MSNPTLKARRLYDYQNDTLNERTIIATASDDTGANSITNDVLYWDVNGVPISIFTPDIGARNPRMVNSRDYAYFADGVDGDQKKWEITTGASKWGITAPTTTLTVGVPGGGGGITNNITPVLQLNGWAPGAHVGSYEGGNSEGFFFGVDLSHTTLAYSNPQNAIDGDDTTFASCFSQTTQKFFGAVWGFTDVSLLNGLTLNVLSEVPVTGTDGLIVSLRSAGIWYTLDGGGTWTQVYNQASRSKQWDSIPLPDLQDLTQVKVMAFTDCHAAMYHKVYEIGITGVTFGNAPVTLLSGRRYYSVFKNPVTENYSDLSPISASTGVVSGAVLPLSDIPVSTDPQVTKVDILATADGGDPAILYFLLEVNNGTTTAQDGTPEESLLTADVFFFTDDSGNEFGVADNTPPPDGDFPTKHRGRIWMIIGEELAFSKNIVELETPTGNILGRYEEDWPATNRLDISQDAEVGKGLFSDGQTLYVGTNRHIRRVLGDSPSNFVKPEVVFNEVGVLNQDVWQVVFLEGTPVGTIWMTPDYRVILSDFNTYNDIGTAVQTTLNSINKEADDNAWSMFVADGPYALYLLAIPTGTNTDPDTLLVYDMHLKQWFIWEPIDGVIAGLFYINLGGTPRWLFVDATGTVRIFDKTNVLDRSGDTDAAGIASVLQSSWLDLGDSMMRKTLNEVETTTDIVDTLVSVDAATTSNEFLAPFTVIDNEHLRRGTFGELKTFLVSRATKDRYYRIRWTSLSDETSTPDDVILGAFSIEAMPVHRV